MEDQKLQSCLAEADAASAAIDIGEGPEALYLPLHSIVQHALDGEHTQDEAEGQKIHPHSQFAGRTIAEDAVSGDVATRTLEEEQKPRW